MVLGMSSEHWFIDGGKWVVVGVVLEHCMHEIILTSIVNYVASIKIGQ